jgi:hypothetical protein
VVLGISRSLPGLPPSLSSLMAEDSQVPEAADAVLSDDSQEYEVGLMAEHLQVPELRALFSVDRQVAAGVSQVPNVGDLMAEDLQAPDVLTENLQVPEVGSLLRAVSSDGGGAAVDSDGGGGGCGKAADAVDEAEMFELTPSMSAKLGSKQFRSAQDLADYPYELVGRILHRSSSDPTVVKRRIHCFLRNQFVLHTKFSGRLSAEAWMRFMGIALRAHDISLADNWLILHSACDTSRLSRKVYDAHPSHLRPAHFAKSVQSSLPQEHLDMVDSLRPLDSASPVEKAKCYTQMDAYLSANKDTIFNPKKRVRENECYEHPGMACHCVWQRFPELNEQENPVPLGDSKAISAEFASPVCVAFSLVGKRMKLADGNTESMVVHHNAAGASGHDMYTVENVSRFPTDNFRAKMDDQHHVVDTVHDALTMGFLAKRARLSLSALGPRLLWKGPTTPKDIAEDFRHIFHCEGALVTIDDLLDYEDAGEVNDVCKRFANLRGIMSLKGGEWSDMCLQQLLTNCEKAHYRRYLSRCSAEIQSGTMPCVVADLMTNPDEKDGRYGKYLPTLVRNSVMTSLTRNRILTPGMLDFLHGWPTLNIAFDADVEKAERYKMYMEAAPVRLSDTLNFSQCVAMQGNGVHLAAQMAWQLYIMSHVERVDAEFPFYQPLDVKPNSCPEQPGLDNSDDVSSDLVIEHDLPGTPHSSKTAVDLDSDDSDANTMIMGRGGDF